jgi:hypothetical protein
MKRIIHFTQFLPLIYTLTVMFANDQHVPSEIIDFDFEVRLLHPHSSTPLPMYETTKTSSPEYTNTQYALPRCTSFQIASLAAHHIAYPDTSSNKPNHPANFPTATSG